MHRIADVGVVDPAVGLDLGRERGHLVRAREHAGLVHQARREAERPQLHAFADERPHLSQLFDRWLTLLVISEHLAPDGVVPDVEGDVGSDALLGVEVG